MDAIPQELSRTRADSYAAEVLPLLAACRFLEDQAEALLKPRHLGRKGLPFWLAGIDSTVERAAVGVVLIIAPANYPLFLAGTQALQALAAGNAVVWKPGRGGRPVAEVFRDALLRAGLPARLLRVTADSTEAGVAAIADAPDKIVFTGSSQAGRAVMRLAAERAIPVVAELSGCDAVIVLPSADPRRVVDALAFGLRLNGSATCMAPRRLFLMGAGHEPLLEVLEKRVRAMAPVELSEATSQQLARLAAQAEAMGARVSGSVGARVQHPVLVLDASPEMEIACADIFAPVLSVLRVANAEQLCFDDSLCPYGLTAAIFGEEREARALGAQLNVGTIVVNDLIVPTADPRVPFGGRRGSGFGVTRGAEGLLEMTAPKVVAVRRGRGTRHYEETSAAHEELFRGAVAMSHAGTLKERFAGLRKLMRAAINMDKR